MAYASIPKIFFYIEYFWIHTLWQLLSRYLILLRHIFSTHTSLQKKKLGRFPLIYLCWLIITTIMPSATAFSKSTRPAVDKARQLFRVSFPTGQTQIYLLNSWTTLIEHINSCFILIWTVCQAIGSSAQKQDFLIN